MALVLGVLILSALLPVACGGQPPSDKAPRDVPATKGQRMLGEHPIDVVLLATDLESSKEFYAGKLGLRILSESEEEITYQCGGDSRLLITKSTTGTADEQTQAGWRVKDLAAEIAELRSRGVEVQDYDMPELKTLDGVADLGFALVAWIVDPHGNALAITELK